MKIFSKKTIFITVLVVGIIQLLRHYLKSSPPGTSHEGELLEVKDDAVSFYTDMSYKENGSIKRDYHILDKIQKMIEQADTYILLDVFLFNTRSKKREYPDIFSQTVDMLRKKKKANPDIAIDIITDPMNLMYGTKTREAYKKLKKHGIQLILTNTDHLRDNNFLFSPIWRSIPFKSLLRHIPVPSKLGGSASSLYTVLSYLQLKANHRKVIICDRRVMITSANVNQDSYPNSNTALVIEDERVAADVYKSEQAVAHMSDAQLQPYRYGKTDRKKQTVKSSHAVQVLTERAIEKRCIHLLQNAQAGDIVYLYTLFIHHKRIEQEIIRASERGAKIRIVLDPNAKLFSGDNPIRLPNSYIARTMERYPNIEIRIYNAADGQFHTKLYTFQIGSDTYVLQGSANLVRMNLADYNLDSMFFVHAKKTSDFTRSIDEYVSSIWNNTKHKYTYGNKLKPYYDGITKHLHHIQRLTKVGV